MNEKIKRQPISEIMWLHRDQLEPNPYNPNVIAPPEGNLLDISLQADGWCMPIICYRMGMRNIIVDGFQKWTRSGQPHIYALTDGYVPVVFINPKDDKHRMASTIRFNRARGTHTVLRMADIVKDMIDGGMPMEQIMAIMGMEEEEVIRLANRLGIPQSDIIKGTGFSQSWSVK